MSAADIQENVTKFFDGYARNFHSIYLEHEKSAFRRWYDRWLRSSMFNRFAEVYNICQQFELKSLLDVGCGPGVHDFMLAKGLGMKITGIDVSPSMVEISKNNAAGAGVSELCQFQVVDFYHYQPNNNFDASLSLGVVEYIAHPASFVQKMASHSNQFIFFSLPIKWHWLTPQRVIRYKLRNCPLYFYSKFEVEKLLHEAGLPNFEIRTVGRDYLVVVRTGKNASKK